MSLNTMPVSSPSPRRPSSHHHNHSPPVRSYSATGMRPVKSSPAPSPHKPNSKDKGVYRSSMPPARPSSSSGYRKIPRSTSACVRSTSSRLPGSDCMSYFPPFESMGSTDPSSESSSEGCSAGSCSTARDTGSHGKGRSLGSLVGLMSFLSPGIQSSPGSKTSSMSSSPTTARSADGAAVEALSKRFTPGKRRVLEPMAVAHEMEHKLPVAARRRRQGSEAEIESLLARRRERVLSGKAKPDLDDELVVESLIAESTPSKGKQHLLSLQLPSLPAWRYPIPSPPVATICPEIPLEAFDSTVENPIASPSRVTSINTSKRRSSASSARSTLSQIQTHNDEIDQVEDDLSPTASKSRESLSTDISGPSTPCLEKEENMPVKITLATSPNASSPREIKWYHEKAEEGYDSEKTIKARKASRKDIGPKKHSWDATTPTITA